MNIRKLFQKKSVATETLYFLLSNVAFAFIPFLLLPFLTEVLSTEEYGQIAIFSLLTAVFSTFVGLNLHGAIAVYCHKYKEDVNDYIQNSIYISTFVLFLSILLVFIFNSFLVQFTGLKNEYLFYVPLVSYFQHNINLYLVKIQNDFNANLYAYLKVSQGICEGLSTYVLVYEYEMGVIGRIYSAVFISVIYFLFIFWTNSKEIKSFKLNILFSRKLLNFGIPLIPHAFFTIVMSISDRFIIANKLNLSEKVIIHKPTLEINKLYQEAYLVVNISKRPEGFGRTISEALSSAKVVIAPNQGGTKEQLYKFDRNLLFNVNSYNSFEKAFKYVLKNYQLISKRGRTYVKKNFSSAIMCKKTFDVYSELVNQ